MNLSNQNVLHIKTEKQEFLRFKKLMEFSDIINHAYAVGLDKNYRTFKANRRPLSVEEYRKNMNNYKILCEEIGLDYTNIIKANQAHTDNIVIVDKLNKDRIDTEKHSDGLITNKKNVILATTNADCILLLMFDPKKKVIANIHSGWRGTIQRISVKAVKKMEEEFGCNPRDIIVCICPSIRKCHFEVGSDVYEMFYKEFKDIDKIMQKDEGKEKWYIDTVLINKKILQCAGILEDNIEDSKICSVCNKDKIHSYRAEGQSYGLSTAIIALK